jgi:hypothetical protein
MGFDDEKIKRIKENIKYLLENYIIWLLKD